MTPWPSARARVDGSESLFPLLLTFAIPLFQFARLNFVGDLFVSDAILLVISPIVLFHNTGKAKDPRFQHALILAGIWLSLQIFTDLVRGTPSADYLRGWAKVSLSLYYLAILYKLLNGRANRIILYFVGASFGLIIGYFLVPNEASEAQPWKWGYGYGVTQLVIVFATFIAAARAPGARLWALLLLFSIGAFNVFEGARSLGLTCILNIKPQNTVRPRRGGLVAVVIILGGLGVAGTITFQVYSSLAKSGQLGIEAQEKYNDQAQGEYGALIGGRTESVASGAAILDSPLMGHGSWAKDCKYITLISDFRRDHDYKDFGTDDDTCLIPSHSFLFGAWVESGFAGAVFWLFVLSLCFRLLLSWHQLVVRLEILYIFITVTMIWDIFFSPYGGERRFLVTFAVAAILWGIRQPSTKNTALGHQENQVDQPVGAYD
jgi:hypothetical protein